MTDKQLCPPSNVLADFMQGKVVEPQLSEFAEHLENCAKCQASALTLHPSDTLVDSLRGEALTADEIARAVPRPLMERLKNIPQIHARSLAGAPADEDFTFLEPPQQADEIGRLGRFRVLKVLGQGGMGTVFLAEDPQLGRPAALKVMLPKVAKNPTAKDRFLREARAAARLRNDHIVTVYEVAEANGVPYLAMELLEGQSLAEMVETGKPLNVAEIICIARDIAAGLTVAHDKGLVHRDIKPGNLWLERDSAGSTRVKILDFGLARQQDESQLTHAGALVGTPAFMAPEQARNDTHVDARADLFSLGCVLYLLSTGRIPFAAATTIGTLMALATESPPPPAKLNQKIPPKLSQLILQLLEKDPARRPQSARDVSQRLIEIERSLPVGKAAERKSPAWTSFQWLLFIGLVGVFLACAFTADLFLPTLKNYFSPQPNVPVADPLVLDAPEVTPADEPSEIPNATESTDPDRRAAEWILSIGGKMQINDGPWIEKTDRLPEEPFAVTQINLVFNSSNTDDGLTHCKGLKQLTVVNADSTNVSDVGLEHLRENTQLAELYLFDSNVSDAGLAHLRNMKELKVLGLGSCSQVTDKGLIHLQGLEKLTRVYLDATQVTDASLPWLKKLKGLQLLDLGVVNVSQAGLLQLKDFPALTSICLRGTPTTDDTLQQFKNLKLTELNLDATQITDDGLEYLTGHPLTTLYLRNTKVSAGALTKFHEALPGCQVFHDGGILQPDQPQVAP